ncbi:hypothetical protein [Planctomycetes bacterium TBK1r]|uniref:DUF4266 domain-containing protein n=1 Tax=Stieleria magnilauensis TaxID=2527963 RepID=A0ABX5XU49_9BACT|nr:hypothetical protein TBK1r_42360 [Planctomycetes bacterium TBK1r]
MNMKMTQNVMRLALGGLLVSTTGCATGRLPWLAKREDRSSMESYVAQAASNIEYNTDVDLTQDYQPNAQPVASYTTPSQPGSRSSGGVGGSCCH